MLLKTNAQPNIFPRRRVELCRGHCSCGGQPLLVRSVGTVASPYCSIAAATVAPPWPASGLLLEALLVVLHFAVFADRTIVPDVVAGIEEVSARSVALVRR